MAGKLTTHVLDTAQGRPAAGMRIDLHRACGDGWELVKSVVTTATGRTDEPLLTGDDFQSGIYRLMFHVEEYFAAQGSPEAGKFLTLVPVVVTLDDSAGDYHVPLLISPWSYTIYRGS